MEADVQEHRCEYHKQQDVENEPKTQAKDLLQGGFFKNSREGFLPAEASLQSYCLGA